MAPALQIRRSRSARGASTVEVALSMVLLIPTLLYVIYAGEAFLAGTRAQEAEISASWDLTAYRLHDFINGYDYEGGDTSVYQQVSDRVALQTERDMHRLDSYRYDQANQGDGQRLVLSEQHLQDVRCGPVNATQILDQALLTFAAMPQTTRQLLHRGGYVGCEARVTFSPQFMPRDMRMGYTGKVDMLSQGLDRGFTACGIGESLWGCETKSGGIRNPNDAIKRGLVVLTNDWGLENGAENPVGQEVNQEYFNVGQAVYRVKGEDVEGGLAHQQIQEALQFLLDEPKETDYGGDSSRFKFGFYNPLKQSRRYLDDDHAGNDFAHLSPWDQRDSTSAEDVLMSRDQRNYLGHYNPNYNEP